MAPTPGGSALTALWAWDNPVDPGGDPRGRGYAPAAPDRLRAFALAAGVREVFLPAAPGTGDDPVDRWLRETVATLHDAGLAVSAVTGVRGATGPWARAAASRAPFDRLQVAVLPWGDPGPGEPLAGVGAQVRDALAAVRSAAGGVPVDACVPWWSATQPAGDGGGTVLDRVLDGSPDRVVLAAPGAHAAGPDGVLARAAAGVRTLTAAGRPFLVGVQTDPPEAAGGADRTFWDEGAVAMVQECRAVDATLAGVPGFRGLAVSSHRAWRRLLGV